MAVFLKPLQQAVRDRDNIYAVIKGSATNQDGTSLGITAPNPEAQAQLLLKCWSDASIEPESISYIEAHGTATKLGDPIEIDGLKKAFSRYTDDKQFCAVSSLKSTTGHLYDCSGIAGLVKAVLALKYKKIPPTAHFKEPNRNIDFIDSPVYVNTRLREWNADAYPRRCGVSSFGISGTNCHIVLEEAPTIAECEGGRPFLNIFTLSAQSKGSLIKLIQCYKDFLKKGKNYDDICYTANTGRFHYNYRIAAVVRNFNELSDIIDLLVRTDFERTYSPLFFYGYHDNKRFGKKNLSINVDKDLLVKVQAEMKTGGNFEYASKLCKLYTDGADIDWNSLYQNGRYNRTSIPVYQFDNEVCWLKPKDVDNLYYSVNWVNEECPVTEVKTQADTVLVLKADGAIRNQELTDRFRQNGSRVIEIGLGDVTNSPDRNTCIIRNSVEDYVHLMEQVEPTETLQIVYLLSMGEKKKTMDPDILSGSVLKELISTLNLLKAIDKVYNGTRMVRLAVVAENVNEVTGSELYLNPFPSSLFGFCRAANQEYENVVCKAVDIDATADADTIVDEIEYNTGSYLTAYRDSKRYVETFGKVDTEQTNGGITLKEDGTYIITGGTGAIGLEVAKFFSTVVKAKIILVNRSEFPCRSEWAHIEELRADKKLCEKIRIIREIEASGSSVDIYSADISSSRDSETLFSTVRLKYGTINGIVHAAGIASSNHSIVDKGKEELINVISPKIYGLLNIDQMTQNDDIDFLLLCSSIATIFPAPFQADYVAGNTFLDSYAAFRNKQGKNTIVIDWATWAGKGMAFEHGFAIDTIFKTLQPGEAVECLKTVMGSELKRIIIGELNYKYAKILTKSQIKLSGSIRAFAEKASAERWPTTKISTGNKGIVLLGKDLEQYTVTEKRLGMIIGDILDYSELNIYDNLFELGANSITLMKIASKIKSNFSVQINLNAFIDNANISKIAEIIDSNKGQSENTARAAVKPDFANLYEPFPLTDVQMAYFVGRNAYYELGGVSTHAYMEIESTFDHERLQRAVQKVINRHEMLRTIVLPDGRQQVLKETPPYDIHYEDKSDLDDAKLDLYINEQRKKMSHNIFKPDKWPLFDLKVTRISSENCLIFIGIDMLIADAESTQIIADEIISFYNDEKLVLPEIQFTFRDYVLAYKESKNSAEYENDKSYWLEKIELFPQAPKLPLQTNPASIIHPHFSRKHYQIDPFVFEQLKGKAKKYGVTPSAILCTLYCKVLAYWSNQPHMAINITTFNRLPINPDVDKLVGDFTTVMLLDIDMQNDINIWNEIKNTHRTIIETLSHSLYEGVELIGSIAAQSNLGNRAVMPIVFTSMIFEEIENSFNQLGKMRYGISQTSQVYLDNQVSLESDGLCINWDYVEELFDPVLIDNMFEEYIDAILKLTKHENIVLELPQNDIATITQYNDTKQDIPECSLHMLFKKAARSNPHGTAVVYNDSSITYEELDKSSDRLARFLYRKGIGRGSLVGVIVKRRIETIINILGILKSGAAYVPIDPTYPEDRKTYIASNSSCKIILESDFYTRHEVFNESPSELHGNDNPDDIAYVIYTSGSTGNPKGVVITHKAASNTILDINEKYAVTSSDRIIGLSSMCFDLSVYDIFGALAAGATLVLVDDQRDAHIIADTLISKKITIWNSVPAIMSMLIMNLNDNYRSSDLRLVLLSGDWIPLSLPEAILNHFSSAEIISLGGATEGSIWSIYFPIKEVKKEWTSIPYGYPLANQQIYVLNYNKQICPTEVVGELYIGGTGVAKGYMNDGKKTADAFVFHDKLGYIYKTGDFGVLHNRDGLTYVEFLGRRDSQVKIRGYRIELGEIEDRLQKFDGVKDAVAVDRVDSKGDKYICAYIVTNSQLDRQELREYLSQKLPSYMIPQQFVKIDAIPLTPNGKVDRNKLPHSDIELPNDTIYEAPTTETGRVISEAFEKVLVREKVGVNETFMDLAINSINMVQIVNMVCKHFDIKITFNEFMVCQKISDLISLVEKKIGDRRDVANVVDAESTSDGIKDECYYWSPVTQWNIRDGRVEIDEYSCPSFVTNIFQDFYFAAQKGITLQSLIEIFPSVGHTDLYRFVGDLVKENILVKSIVSPQRLFSAEDRLFKSDYGEEIIYNQQANLSFKVEQLNRTYAFSSEKKVELINYTDADNLISSRRSVRKFNEKVPIKFDKFSRVLSALGQRHVGNHIVYNYASAGGLYPVDIFLYVKDKRVEGIERGFYYYNPRNNHLCLVNDSNEMTADSYYFTNKEIFLSSSFTIFLIYNANVSMPKYKGNGLLYAFIDSGIITELITQIAQTLDIGLCSIGDMKVDELRKNLKLSDTQLWLHTIECGLKPENND